MPLSTPLRRYRNTGWTESQPLLRGHFRRGGQRCWVKRTAFDLVVILRTPPRRTDTLQGTDGVCPNRVTVYSAVAVKFRWTDGIPSVCPAVSSAVAAASYGRTGPGTTVSWSIPPWRTSTFHPVDLVSRPLSVEHAPVQGGLYPTPPLPASVHFRGKPSGPGHFTLSLTGSHDTPRDLYPAPAAAGTVAPLVSVEAPRAALGKDSP